jgi:hypothetical protein
MDTIRIGYLCLRFAIIPDVPEARIVNLSTKALYFAVTLHLFRLKHNGMFHDIIPNTGKADITNQ